MPESVIAALAVALVAPYGGRTQVGVRPDTDAIAALVLASWLFTIESYDNLVKLAWVQLWFCKLCPSAATLAAISGYAEIRVPWAKNVAFAP